MKAGKLVHVITVQRFTSAPNEYGTPIEAWSDLATLRAEVVEQSTEEFIRAQGAAEESAIVFRTRFLAGIGNGDIGNEDFGRDFGKRLDRQRFHGRSRLRGASAGNPARSVSINLHDIRLHIESGQRRAGQSHNQRQACENHCTLRPAPLGILHDRRVTKTPMYDEAMASAHKKARFLKGKRARWLSCCEESAER